MVCKGIKTWRLPQCAECKLHQCCEGLDNLRDPITDGHVIIGYRPGCRHYSPKGDQ